MPKFLFTRHPNLERSWPFLHEHMLKCLGELGEVVVLNSSGNDPIHRQTDMKDVVGLAYFGGGPLTAECINAAQNLRILAVLTDNTGHGLPLETLSERKIPIIDTTRSWAQSVAELSIGLALCALRRITQWHYKMANAELLWTYPYAQFCDAPDFVNGDLGRKPVGVVGLGQIGRRIAQWCRAFGSVVYGYDPFVPISVYNQLGVIPVEMDKMVELVDIIFIAISPSPSSKGLLSRERIYKLHPGALVVITTRAQPVDMVALRERILANELAAAFDVYDVEPLPVDDPLRGRDNVVHTPHIAGRTKDANHRIAELIRDDFERVLKGGRPLAELTLQAIAVKTQVKEIPPMPQV